MLAQNHSERFESRFTSVQIEPKTKAIMLKDMQESVMGVWVAHGEGKFTFKNQQIAKQLEKDNCIALRYTDDDGNWTME